jgi:hypothetical protein
MGNKDLCSSENSNFNKDDKTNSMASVFFSLPPNQYALLSALIAVLLAENLDLNQQNSLGNFIVNVGSTMLTIAAQGQLIESNSKKTTVVNRNNT